jgi:putative hydrolase of the HAD superfamily
VRYTTILFDVGDTLVHVPRPAPYYHRMLMGYGCSLEVADVERILEETRRVMDERVPRWLGEDLTLDSAATTLRRTLHVDTIISLAGVSCPEVARQAFFDLYVGTEFFTIFPDVTETLAALRGEGYRLGIVSNWESRLLSLCEAHGIAHVFDFAVVSELEGYSKPHPQLYRRALELAGEPPERVLHVGDKLREDVEGAAAVGIRAILIDRNGAALGEYEPRISSLGELPGLLATL